ncbi:hypothetical protein ACJX0J_026899, partial [Zea mays]
MKRKGPTCCAVIQMFRTRKRSDDAWELGVWASTGFRHVSSARDSRVNIYSRAFILSASIYSVAAAPAEDRPCPAKPPPRSRTPVRWASASASSALSPIVLSSPLTDAAAPKSRPDKGGGKGPSSCLDLDVEWIAEHARQVIHAISQACYGRASALETAAESSSILEPESASACSTLESLWDMVPGSRSGQSFVSSLQKKDDSSKRQGGGNFSIIDALIVLLVALIAGLLFTFSAGSNTCTIH